MKIQCNYFYNWNHFIFLIIKKQYRYLDIFSNIKDFKSDVEKTLLIDTIVEITKKLNCFHYYFDKFMDLEFSKNSSQKGSMIRGNSLGILIKKWKDFSILTK